MGGSVPLFWELKLFLTLNLLLPSYIIHKYTGLMNILKPSSTNLSVLPWQPVKLLVSCIMGCENYVKYYNYRVLIPWWNTSGCCKTKNLKYFTRGSGKQFLFSNLMERFTVAIHSNTLKKVYSIDTGCPINKKIIGVWEKGTAEPSTSSWIGHMDFTVPFYSILLYSIPS